MGPGVTERERERERGERERGGQVTSSLPPLTRYSALSPGDDDDDADGDDDDVCGDHPIRTTARCVLVYYH